MSNEKEIREALDAYGWTFERHAKGGHTKWRHPDHRMLIVSFQATGSSFRNLMQSIKRGPIAAGEEAEYVPPAKEKEDREDRGVVVVQPMPAKDLASILGCTVKALRARATQGSIVDDIEVFADHSGLTDEQRTKWPRIKVLYGARFLGDLYDKPSIDDLRARYGGYPLSAPEPSPEPAPEPSPEPSPKPEVNYEEEFDAAMKLLSSQEEENKGLRAQVEAQVRVIADLEAKTTKIRTMLADAVRQVETLKAAPRVATAPPDEKLRHLATGLVLAAGTAAQPALYTQLRHHLIRTYFDAS